MFESLNTFFGHPLVSVLFGAASGAAVNWFFSWRYYKKAGDELKAEATRLQRTTEMILRWLEAKGEDVSVIRQADGTPTGLAHTIEMAAPVHATASVGIVVTRAPENERLSQVTR